MRILVIGTFAADSGNHNLTETTADLFERQGHEVIRTSRYRGGLLRTSDVLSTVWAKRGDYELAIIDIYDAETFGMAEQATAMLRRFGKRFVIHLHGGKIPILGHAHPARMRRLLGEASAVTTPSPYVQQSLMELCSDIEVIPDPLPLHLYPSRARPLAEPNLIVMRSFHQVHNPLMAVEVAAVLRTEYPLITLTMIGQDRGDGSLAAVRAAGAGLGDRLTISPPLPLDQVPAVLDAHDVFLNTTNIDSPPTPVIEAMACGLCVVSTDAGGLRYLLDNGENAMLVPTNDAIRMINAVRRILTSAPLAAHLSEQAQAFGRQSDQRVVAARWEAILTRVHAQVG